MPTKMVSLRIDEVLLEYLTERAKLEHRTLSNLIVSILLESEGISAQPKIIRCKNCKHHHYENGTTPYCDRIDYGYGWRDDDFCSMAERKGR